MLTKWSGIGMIEGSGKLQGTVMFKGRSGAMARVNTKGVNPQTSKQIARRATLSTRSQAWKGLTAAQRAAWNAAAASGQFPQVNRLGVTYNPTGAQLYTKLNTNIVLLGGTAITEPPIKTALTQVLLTALTAADGTPALSLTFSGTLDAAEGIILYATPNLSPGITRPGASQYRYLTTYTSTSPADLLTAYQALYGDPVEGQKIFIKGVIGNDTVGLTSLVGEVSAVVAA